MSNMIKSVPRGNSIVFSKPLKVDETNATEIYLAHDGERAGITQDSQKENDAANNGEFDAYRHTYNAVLSRILYKKGYSSD